jgi:hypothetical protein
MPTKAILKARFDDAQLIASFRAKAAANGITESELLRRIVSEHFRQPPTDLRVVAPPAESPLTKITVRVPESIKPAIENRAQLMGMKTSRWIAALVQSNLMKPPVLAEAEINAVCEQSRELNAIGRNLNQIAKALNEHFNETDRVKQALLAELQQAIQTSKSLTLQLVQARHHAWV